MPLKKRTTTPPSTPTASFRDSEEDAKQGRNPFLQGQHFDVYTFIQRNPGCTRDDVARGTGIKASTATARVKELIDEGYIIEPPGERKLTRAGVRAKTLRVTGRKAGGAPLDRVRVELELTIDCNGHYGVKAKVVGGLPQQNAVTILRKKITLTAPHPDTYKSLLDDAEVSTVSRMDSAAHAGDIIDADYTPIED